MKAALGEYWPEVLIVQTGCSKVCPKYAEGWYTPCMTRSWASWFKSKGFSYSVTASNLKIFKSDLVVSFGTMRGPILRECCTVTGPIWLVELSYWPSELQYIITWTCNNKHWMTGHKGNSEFCFPETLNVPRGEAGTAYFCCKLHKSFPTWRPRWTNELTNVGGPFLAPN